MKRFFYMLLVGAIAGGLAWVGYTAYKKYAAAKEAATEEQNSAERSRTQTAPTPGTRQNPSAKPAAVIESTSDLKFLSAEFDRAARAYKQCKFDEAAGLLKPYGRKSLPADWLEKVADLSARATAFASFIANLTAAEMVGHSNMVVLDLTTGGKVEGYLLEENPTSVKIRRIGGIVADIPRSQIRIMQKLDPVLAKDKLEQEYKDKLKRLGSNPSPIRYVELGILCYKQKLLPQTLDAFERAYAADRAIGERYADEQARLLYQMYLWFLGAGKAKDAAHNLEQLLCRYPGSKYAAVAKEDMKNPGQVVDDDGKAVAGGEKPTGSTPDSGATGTSTQDESVEDIIARGENLFDNLRRKTARIPKSFKSPEISELVATANAAFDRGVELMLECNPNSPDAAERNRKAIDELKKACRTYEKALELDGNNSWLEARYREANLYRTNCVKRAMVWR
jgi:tetratricopeptide (TPR) repeat protein